MKYRVLQAAQRRLHRLNRSLASALLTPRLVSAQRMPEQAFLAEFDLEVVDIDPRPHISGLQAVTREALLAHYGRRVQADKQRPQALWPRPPDWIRDPRVEIAELNEKQLIALANEFLGQRFVLGEYPPLTTAEGKLDWHSSPSSDAEWLWALHRHQWWCIWALAYERTGDERYAAAFVEQMLEWVASFPPAARKDEKSASWRLMEVAVRMRTSWIPCFAIFFNSAAFTDDAKMTMLRAIYDHARFLYLFQTTNNHFIQESNGLAYVSTTFPEFRQASRWLTASLARLEGALIEQVNPDGSHFELSTGYQSLVLSEYQSTYDLLQTNGIKLPRQDLAAWITKMYRMIAFLARPDGSLPHINDGFLYWKTPYLARAGRALKCDDLVYVGTFGRQGTPPAETSIRLSDAGLYVMRSGWETDARYMLLDAGAYGGFHGHEDKLSIEVHAFGQTFIADPGCHNYDPADPLRVHFVSSQAHNTIVVDGKSQIRRWHKENLRPRTDQGANHTIWVSQPEFDYVCASYDEGYGDFSLKKNGKADTHPSTNVIEDVVHTRHVLFVKPVGDKRASDWPDYWLIVDELHASMPHNYQLLFHTVPGISVTVDAHECVALCGGSEAAKLCLIPAELDNIQVSCLTASQDPIQGWYSADFGHKAPATTVIYERKNSTSTVLATLLYPCPAHQKPVDVPTLTLDLSICGGEERLSARRGLAFAVSGVWGRDDLIISREFGLKQFGPYQTEAMIAGVRTDSNGRIQARFEGGCSDIRGHSEIR